MEMTKGTQQAMTAGGSLLETFGGLQTADAYEEIGRLKDEEYKSTADQLDARGAARLAVAAAKARETERLGKRASSDYAAKVKGGAGDPSVIKEAAKRDAHYEYQELLTLAMGLEQQKSDEYAASQSRAAGARARAAGGLKGKAARTAAYGGFLKGIGKSATLADKYSDYTKYDDAGETEEVFYGYE